MPYADNEGTITTLLELPLLTVNKRELLTTLVLSGEVISSEIVIRGIHEFLEDAKTSPWMLHDQGGWILKEWLKLLPFSERPDAILEILDSTDGFTINPMNLRDLLSALSYAPSAKAETVLYEFAKRDERFLNEYNWLAALERRNTLSAARLLLDLICNMTFAESRGRPDHTNLGRELSTFMVSHDQFRKDIYERFPVLDDGPAKAVLKYAIAETADADGVFLLIRDGAARDKDIRSTGLYQALRHVLIGQTPVESSGMCELYSLPAAELRKDLFDMVVTGNAAESQLATECLSAIDEIRDDYGHLVTEPRHPDVSTGVPWPIVDQKGEKLRENLAAVTRGECGGLPKKVETRKDLAKAADDIFKFNIPVIPGVVGVNLNSVIKQIGNWWKGRKNK